MKKNILLVLMCLGMSQFSISVSLAAEADSVQPCMKIKKACLSAGFKKSNNKLSAKDCMSKILKGEKVEGVDIESAAISSCTEKHEK